MSRRGRWGLPPTSDKPPAPQVPAPQAPSPKKPWKWDVIKMRDLGPTPDVFRQEYEGMLPPRRSNALLAFEKSCGYESGACPLRCEKDREVCDLLSDSEIESALRSPRAFLYATVRCLREERQRIRVLEGTVRELNEEVAAVNEMRSRLWEQAAEAARLRNVLEQSRRDLEAAEARVTEFQLAQARQILD